MKSSSSLMSMDAKISFRNISRKVESWSRLISNALTFSTGQELLCLSSASFRWFLLHHQRSLVRIHDCCEVGWLPSAESPRSCNEHFLAVACPFILAVWSQLMQVSVLSRPARPLFQHHCMQYWYTIVRHLRCVTSTTCRVYTALAGTIMCWVSQPERQMLSLLQAFTLMTPRCFSKRCHLFHEVILTPAKVKQ